MTQVGTDCSTAGEAACNELLMVLPYIRKNVCLALNKRLQNGAADIVPVDNADFDIAAKYAGAFADGEELNATGLNGKRSGCFQATTTPADAAYVFFAVLAPR